MKNLAIAFLAVALFACGSPEKKETQEVITTKVQLGKKLFFDPILSLDNTISCASCHKPEFAFADNRAFSLGVGDSMGTRNTPSVMNMAGRSTFFWDGRAGSLEAQARMPIENPVEMNLHYDKAVRKVQLNKEYQNLFLRIYQHAPNEENVANALAEFQRSLESDGSAPHDLWINEKEPSAFDSSQIRGRELFINKAKCFDCHFGPDFTGDEFRNIGLYDEVTLKDKGRWDVTKKEEDLGKFKVPGLRNVELTAPYMHNGMFKTLEEVIDFYDNPYNFVEKPINLDPIMVEPLNLTKQEKLDLLNFLKGLTDRTRPTK